MLDHKLLEEMDFRLPALTLHLYLFAPQSLPRWKSLQQHLPPSLSRHLALGAWIRHQAHLGRRRLQYPYLQSFNPQLLRSSRTPPCFDSFSQHFRLPCSSTMPVWTWQKSTKVRRNRFKSHLSTFNLQQRRWLMATGYKKALKLLTTVISFCSDTVVRSFVIICPVSLSTES